MTKNKYIVLLLLSIAMVLTSCNETDQKETMLYIVEVNDKLGYIDQTGKIVIEPQYDNALDFEEGLAWVRIEDHEYYIDETGKIVIDQPFPLRKSNMSEGLAIIEIYVGNDERYHMHEKYGFIDKTGKCVINPKYAWAENFHEGLAEVKVRGDSEGELVKTGYINREGMIVIEPQFQSGSFFSEGLAPVEIANKWGYIDKSGHTTIPLQFDYANPFSEGLALVKINDKWGYINKAGEIKINPVFDDAHDFHEGLAYIVTGGEAGYINQLGEYAIPPQFEAHRIDNDNFFYSFNDFDYKGNDFSEGLAAVSISGKYYYIDKNGKIAINQPFGHVGCFHNGLTRIWWNRNDDVEVSSIIDKTGKVIWTDNL